MTEEAAFATRPMDKSPTSIGEPHLVGEERDLLDRVLSGVRKYMEFGLGGSTLAAARAGVSEIVAVDSDAVWVEVAWGRPYDSWFDRPVAPIYRGPLGRMVASWWPARPYLCGWAVQSCVSPVHCVCVCRSPGRSWAKDIDARHIRRATRLRSSLCRM